MIKKGLSILLCLWMLLPLMAAGAAGVQAAASVRSIATWDQLAAWAKESSDDRGVTVRLTADLSRPLGSTWTAKANFAGVFDGGNHYISGLSGKNGLLAAASGTVRNLSLLDCSLLSTEQVAAFVGKATGTLRIENCYTDAVIHTSGNNAAGFVGDGYGKSVTIVNSQFDGRVSCALRYVSAFIGNQNSGPCTIENCLNTGSVYAGASNGNAGGFSEAVYNGSLETVNCVNLGSIRYADAQTGFAVTRTIRTGGRVTISNCYNLTGAADSKTYALQGTATLNTKGVGGDFSSVVTDVTAADYGTVAAALGEKWAVRDGELVLLHGVPTRISRGEGASEPDDGKTVVLAASDFQSYEDAHNTCSQQMDRLLSAVKKDHPTADGLLFAGDYYHQYSPTESEKGIAAMMQTVENADMGIAPENIVRVQGNHDERGTTGLSLSGNNDPASGEYGVYVIHEDDYMWFAGSGTQSGSESVAMHEETVKDTAAKLRRYLESKAEQGFTRPVFVVSHLALHYSMRTYVYGDGRYARYLFDELNYGAALGLNIIFVFGHDHSHGWDNHLGGSCVYLGRGETINVGVPSDPAACTREVLGFTYINAGYVGYFTTDHSENVDKTLTMTVYEISDEAVIISRYDENGVHTLKAQGATNGNLYDGKTEVQHGIFTADPAPTPSPQLQIPVTAVIPFTDADCETEGTLGYFETADGFCYLDLGLTEATTREECVIPPWGHGYPEEWTEEDGVYVKICSFCGEKEIHSHCFDNPCDPDCGECGYVRVPADHDYGTYRFDESEHWVECRACGQTALREEHCYDSSLDADCRVCGALREGSLLGDANGDGVVSFGDIQRIYRHLMSEEGLTDDGLVLADANGDGSVSFGDIQRIYQHLTTDNKLT